MHARIALLERALRDRTRGMTEQVERVMGIEPTLAAWEAAVLPLNYTRIFLVNQEAARFLPGRTSRRCGPGAALRARHLSPV